jgi:N12 class adenine-specific DNA methylase/adenine-specific DNA methylase
MSQLTFSLFDTTALSGLTLGASAGPRFREDPVEAAPEPEPEPERVPAHTFRLSGERALARGWKARAADNLAAIRLMQEIETEDRHATPAEQEQLARFVGFGAGELANTLFRRQDDAFRPGWEDLGNELEQLVSPAEMAALARSTQYAHYTPEFMVRAVWAALARMGFAGGTVLEPGCGTGLFLAMMPEKVAARSAATGIEMDPTTARIAKLLYPDAWIRAEDFTKARLAETFDLAVGNPPFSDRTVRADDPAGRLGLSLHDYFIARSIERLKPGGLAAFVTSRHTMDKVDPKAREHIASMADLVGAARMPQGAMLAAAGTEVVVDVLFFQRRRTEQVAGGAAWSDLVEVLPAEDGEPALAVNRYFAEHPGMVLGLHGRTTSPFGVVYTCHYCPTVSLEADLGAALERLPQGIHVPAATPESTPVRPTAAPRVRVGTAAEGATVKEGSYLLLDGALMQVLDGVPQRVAVKSATVKEGIFAKHARIILGLIPLRDAIRAVLRAQEANEPWGMLQGRLRSAYQLFVRQFGPVNLTNISTSTDPKTGEARETVRRPNLQPFLDDPDVWLVSSVEQYDEDAGTAKMGPIFTERVIHPRCEPVITSAADALAVTLHEVGHVDLARVAEMLGRPREQVIAELGDAVFLNPDATKADTEAWETADAYLSGAVRTKLEAATAAAERDPRYARNVDALRRVQPVDLKPSEITARLGAPWIPAAVVQAFSKQVIGVETRVRHTKEVASWSINVDAFEGLAAATSEWGTARRHAGELLHDALNASIPQIWDTWRDADGEHRELNASETEAAKEKLLKIKQAFERWIWTDVERTDRLARLYNDAFNNLVPRSFDGRHLQLPGASSAISLRDHQKRVIWRIIAAGGTYIAHAVGAGKTFSMAAAVMEQKRLGLITKAMMTVPGHCLAQASREFLLLYPNAHILVADETNFSKDKRQRFLARAATATWDAIIITHSAFKFIPAPADFERGLIGDALASYSTLLEKVEGDDRLTRKRIERMKEGLQDKLEALSARKDDLLTIAEMGVDQLIVDEAQEFRKLSFATNMSDLKGVAPDGSQRAWDLHAKARFIAQRQPTRPLILASGTPITNTLGEMFTLQRFMQPQVLEERGIHEFDAWASSFGDTRTELELQPSGLYKPVTRFAEFVNVPELISMFRSVADVVLMDDLRHHLRLPAVRTGKRQIVTAKASPAFRAYQRMLAERIRLIEERKGPPQKGQDILLSVITDGRHAAIDTRFVLGADTEDDPRAGNEPGNKLNALVANVHRIWLETAGNRYLQPDTGKPHPVPGAAQMVFSDLGTEAADGKRGFSAYLWIRDELVRLGVPREQVAFMQDFKKSEAKQKLFAAVNGGKVRVLIGSTQTMGTGVNAQQRLAALHHLDVPWLPSDIEQREGRIERQGNQNPEIGIYAYATLGSVDATSWQLLERKSRFIAAALGGDRSVRRLEDAGSQVNQFAMAKALASGDPRLMQKAGLEAELARLERLREAHFDDQLAIRNQVADAERTIGSSTRRIGSIEQDIAARTPTRGDLFTMEVAGKVHTERKVAGASLLSRIRIMERKREQGA